MPTIAALVRNTHRLRSRLATWRCYSWATSLKMQGATMGSRVALGSGYHFERPWGTNIAAHARVENNVWFKPVEDNAAVHLRRSPFAGTGCEFDVMHKVTIGDHFLIAPGCFITDHNHRSDADRRIDKQGRDADPVNIGSDILHFGVVVLPGVSIGEGAAVAAGAVVNTDVSLGAVVGGIPTQIIGHCGASGSPK